MGFLDLFIQFKVEINMVGEPMKLPYTKLSSLVFTLMGSSYRVSDQSLA